MTIWSPGMSLQESEERVIKKVYDFFSKNAENTAKSLNISLNELNKKMEKFKLKDEKIKEFIEKEKEKEREYIERARGVSPENSLNYNSEKQMPISTKQSDNRYQSNLKHKS